MKPIVVRPAEAPSQQRWQQRHWFVFTGASVTTTIAMAVAAAATAATSVVAVQQLSLESAVKSWAVQAVAVSTCSNSRYGWWQAPSYRRTATAASDAAAAGCSAETMRSHVHKSAIHKQRSQYY